MFEPLTSCEGGHLLALARASIRDAVDACPEGPAVRAVLAEMQIGPALEAPRGVFVTLRQSASHAHPGELRGCIGTLSPRSALYRNVIETAPKSALEDPRFAPLESEEIEGLSVEISALTPREAIQSPDQIVVGVHGVELASGDRHAVFLPQVAREQGWDIAQLVDNLARKAGLLGGPRGDWKLWVFQAEIFEDSGRGAQVPGGGENTR